MQKTKSVPPGIYSSVEVLARASFMDFLCNVLGRASSQPDAVTGLWGGQAGDAALSAGKSAVGKATGNVLAWFCAPQIISDFF